MPYLLRDPMPLDPRKVPMVPVRVNREYPLATNLAGFWLLGASLLDLSGNSSPGSFVGAPPIGNLGKGPATLLNGTSQYVTVPDGPTLHPTSGITVSSFVNGTSFPNAYNAMVQKGNAANFFEYFVKSNGKLAVYMTSATGLDYDGTGIYTLSTGATYNAAFTYDNSVLTGYVNGQVDATTAAVGALGNTAGFTLNIGNDGQTAGRVFAGVIGPVAIWQADIGQALLSQFVAAPFAMLERIRSRTWAFLPSGVFAIFARAGLAAEVLAQAVRQSQEPAESLTRQARTGQPAAEALSLLRGSRSSPAESLSRIGPQAATTAESLSRFNAQIAGLAESLSRLSPADLAPAEVLSTATTQSVSGRAVLPVEVLAPQARAGRASAETLGRPAASLALPAEALGRAVQASSLAAETLGRLGLLGPALPAEILQSFRAAQAAGPAEALSQTVQAAHLLADWLSSAPPSLPPQARTFLISATQRIFDIAGNGRVLKVLA